MDILLRYFPDLDGQAVDRFRLLEGLYREWNERINVISRRDIDHLYERHVLHSLAIYRFLPFVGGSAVLDIGTGGGFPGIPLAIVLPDVHFVLSDSVGKKIRVVREVAEALGLSNVEAIHGRAEQVTGGFDFAVSRAVAPLPELYDWCRNKITRHHRNALPNGLICLKGGDLSRELAPFGRRVETHPISQYFTEPFFEGKQLVYLSMT